MSTLKTNNVQVGQSVTATNNFTIYQPSTPDGTVRIGVGNSGATTSDAVTINSTGIVKGSLVSGTAVTASGTSVDFTGIPSTAKRITVMFNGVSTSGTSGWLLQIGGASFETSAYVSTVTYTGTGSGGSSSTAGFIIVPASAGTASNICTGMVTLALLDSSTNSWVHQTVAGLTQSGTVYSVQGGGSKAITGSLARVRITTVNGTDTFDAGTINIMWEG